MKGKVSEKVVGKGAVCHQRFHNPGRHEAVDAVRELLQQPQNQQHYWEPFRIFGWYIVSLFVQILCLDELSARAVVQKRVNIDVSEMFFSDR